MRLPGRLWPVELTEPQSSLLDRPGECPQLVQLFEFQHIDIYPLRFLCLAEVQNRDRRAWPLTASSKSSIGLISCRGIEGSLAEGGRLPGRGLGPRVPVLDNRHDV